MRAIERWAVAAVVLAACVVLPGRKAFGIGDPASAWGLRFADGGPGKWVGIYGSRRALAAGSSSSFR